MKRRRPTARCTSLRQLGTLLAENGRTLRQWEPPAIEVPDDAPCDPDLLFLQAVADVTPLACNRHAPTPALKTAAACDTESDEDDATRALEQLVTEGRGFAVRLTPEYRAAVAAGVHPELCERLHRGDFPIQDHINLHGCTLRQGRQRLDAFMARAVRLGLCAVLVVHGRGLRSAGRPVLKQMVFQRLLRGRWRRWVLAMASARLCDGGAGATYVLLRRRPAKPCRRPQR